MHNLLALIYHMVHTNKVMNKYAPIQRAYFFAQLKCLKGKIRKKCHRFNLLSMDIDLGALNR